MLRTLAQQRRALVFGGMALVCVMIGIYGTIKPNESNQMFGFAMATGLIAIWIIGVIEDILAKRRGETDENWWYWQPVPVRMRARR